MNELSHCLAFPLLPCFHLDHTTHSCGPSHCTLRDTCKPSQSIPVPLPYHVTHSFTHTLVQACPSSFSSPFLHDAIHSLLTPTTTVCAPPPPLPKYQFFFVRKLEQHTTTLHPHSISIDIHQIITHLPLPSALPIFPPILSVYTYTYARTVHIRSLVC